MNPIIIMKNKIKVAFIGAGYMAKEHIKAFADIEGVELAGILSRTRIKAELLAAEFGITEVCDSITELYQKTQAQLVVISVSVIAVKNSCFEAFEYPWVCLIEKPAGYDLEEAETIAAKANMQGAIAYVALNRRHYSSTTAVMNEFCSIPGPRLVNVFDQEDQVAARKANQPEVVVQNWMYANAIHMVDYLRIFCRGTVESVDPIMHWDAENPGFVAAKILFSSGDIGLYQAIWNGPGPWAVTITTQEKRCELRPLEQATLQLNGSRRSDLMPCSERDTKFKPGLRAQAEEAVKAISGQPHNLPSLSEALLSMRLVKEIYA